MLADGFEIVPDVPHFTERMADDTPLKQIQFLNRLSLSEQIARLRNPPLGQTLLLSPKTSPPTKQDASLTVLTDITNYNKYSLLNAEHGKTLIKLFECKELNAWPFPWTSPIQQDTKTSLLKAAKSILPGRCKLDFDPDPKQPGQTRRAQFEHFVLTLTKKKTESAEERTFLQSLHPWLELLVGLAKIFAELVGKVQKQCMTSKDDCAILVATKAHHVFAFASLLPWPGRSKLQHLPTLKQRTLNQCPCDLRRRATGGWLKDTASVNARKINWRSCRTLCL